MAFTIINSECSCGKIDCSRHGNCYECVKFHRDVKKNVPSCMKSLMPQNAK